jgi:S-DNA-T family DNA segregation ATPase FtsK/SpoIIIE
MNQSLKPYLEYQADRVEAVLSAHQAPGRVTGGTVGPRLIRFFLNPAPNIRFPSIARLSDDLALAMHVPTLSVDRGKEGVILEFAHPNPRSVTLLDLLPEVMPMPFSTAMLGLCDDGAPLLARLSAPEVAHILIAGNTGAGKSALLRTIAASLVLTHMPSLLHMLCIDLTGRTFAAFEGIPHLERKMVTAAQEAFELLHSTVRMMTSRIRHGEAPAIECGDGVQGTSIPRAIILIDDLDTLAAQNESAVISDLEVLVQHGRRVGVHVVAATRSLAGTSIDRVKFPLRIVGRFDSAEDAHLASGRAGTNAHLLTGKGDFLAVSGNEKPIRFQGGYIDEGDLRRQMGMLGGVQISLTEAEPIVYHLQERTSEL